MDEQPQLPMNYGPQIIPVPIAKTLFKALSWTYTRYQDGINEEWESAWAWVEDNKVYYDEMGG